MNSGNLKFTQGSASAAPTEASPPPSLRGACGHRGLTCPHTSLSVQPCPTPAPSSQARLPLRAQPRPPEQTRSFTLELPAGETSSKKPSAPARASPSPERPSQSLSLSPAVASPSPPAQTTGHDGPVIPGPQPPAQTRPSGHRSQPHDLFKAPEPQTSSSRPHLPQDLPPPAQPMSVLHGGTQMAP